MLKPEVILNNIFSALPQMAGLHNFDSSTYSVLDEIRDQCIENLFSINSVQQVELPPFGLLRLPYFSMGAINSTHLFGLDELIIFSFYAANTTRYRRTADIGANIGLHSILMSKLGCEVQCYEPDPVTFERLTSNLILNTVQDSIKSNQKAVSTKSGALEFTRVLGNTTGSHLSGAKTNPYGELERFSVEVVDFIDIMRTVDLMKIDVEGHEADILCKTQLDDWLGVDAIVEIGTVSNAQRVFDHLTDLNVNMFSQKTGWKHVESFEAVPKNYKEGSLFISVKDKMPWGESL